MLKFDKNVAYLVPVREKPISIKFEDSNVCPTDFSIQCKYSKLNFEDDEMKVNCNNCYNDGCILLEREVKLNMKNKITIDTQYYYDALNPLTYEELKKLEVGAIVWCEYSEDWACNVENEIKTIVSDFYNEDEIDLRGSFCCIGCLEETMNRKDKNTIKVYELTKIA